MLKICIAWLTEKRAFKGKRRKKGVLSLDPHAFKTENKLKCREIYLYPKALDSYNLKATLPSVRKSESYFCWEAILKKKENQRLSQYIFFENYFNFLNNISSDVYKFIICIIFL